MSLALNLRRLTQFVARRLALVSFAFTTFVCSVVSAQEIPENFMNARALGMGNAFTTIVDDYNALFYNPAALDRIRGFHLTVLGLQVGTDAYDSYTTLQNVKSSNYASIIQQYYGKQIWLGISDALAFSMKDFAVAGYDFFNLDFILHNPAYSNVYLTATNDYGITTGFALPLVPNVISWGIAVKRVTRYGGQLTVGPGLLASLNSNYITNLLNNFGTGYGLDSGLLIDIPFGIHPTFSLVWQNIGQTTFSPAPGSNAPFPMDNNPIIGFGANIDATVLKVRPVFEYQHINMTSEPLGMLLHMGVEVEFPGFAIRAGANQGYYTAGASLNLKYVTVDAATYGVELGAYPGQTEDRRYIINVTVDLNMNPSFDFGSAAEQSRYRSYQRR